MGRSIGWALAVSAGLGWAGVVPAPAAGQMLDLTPNLMGSWTADPGVVHFHVLHRFQVLDPPSRKVIHTPTLLLPDRRLWGFEFTAPITRSRYFGGNRSTRAASDDVEPAPTAGAARPAGASDTVRVTMDNRLRFLPDTVHVSVGQVVRWENTSDIIHTVTADPAAAVEAGNVRLPEGAAPFDSGDLLPGRDFVHVFQHPGTYEYVCVPHEMAGMIGVVVVTAGG